MYETSRRPDQTAATRRELDKLENEQARLTDAIARCGDVAVLAERLRDTEVRRLALVATLKASASSQAPAWREEKW